MTAYTLERFSDRSMYDCEATGEATALADFGKQLGLELRFERSPGAQEFFLRETRRVGFVGRDGWSVYGTPSPPP